MSSIFSSTEIYLLIAINPGTGCQTQPLHEGTGWRQS